MPASNNLPKVRKVSLDWKIEDFKKHWVNDNPIATHLSNAFHVVFPAGERFFIRSVQAFSDQISDPELKNRVKAFIGQEVQHGKEHEKFWDVLRAQGVSVDRFAEIYTSAAFEYLEPFMRKYFSGADEFALSLTAALEHYTAIMAEAGFQRAKEREELEVNIPEEMSKLFLWHAAEEIEHKSVAFDVLKQVNDSYLLRVSGLIVASLALWGVGSAGQTFFLAEDEEFREMPLLEKWQHLRASFETQAGQFGENLLDYFRPDFHPDDIDNYHLAEDFFAKYPEMNGDKQVKAGAA